MDQGNHSQLHNPYSAALNIDTGSGDRFPQWSVQETRDLLMIRAELDPTFMETKRNKLLWEVISTTMKEKGYTRSAEQCKCKWKNLVTRFKGCEAMEAEGMRQQFPFYNDLQTIFAERMQRMLWLEAEGGGAAASTPKKRKKAAAQYSSSDEEDEHEESEEEKAVGTRRKKIIKGKEAENPSGGTSSGSVSLIINGLKGIMEDYMKKQMKMDMQWIKAYEAREEERRVKEMEWRQKMEALENERIMVERRWRERGEQRRIREEARAEKRDVLITFLLNKLRSEEM